jgi:hypothetical protein
MSIQEIESAIAQLPPEELAELSEWFEEYLAQAWDKQLEQDVQAGRLDSLLKKAAASYDAGDANPL